jgi:antitoxin (DNA-binding transcriptional repressor) of toxin-antitoxin stability system
MVKRVMRSVQEIRSEIGQIAEAMKRGEHIMLSFRGKVFAVITPIDWYREAAVKMKDPTEY